MIRRRLLRQQPLQPAERAARRHDPVRRRREGGTERRRSLDCGGLQDRARRLDLSAQRMNDYFACGYPLTRGTCGEESRRSCSRARGAGPHNAPCTAVSISPAACACGTRHRRVVDVSWTSQASDALPPRARRRGRRSPLSPPPAAPPANRTYPSYMARAHHQLRSRQAVSAGRESHAHCRAPRAAGSRCNAVRREWDCAEQRVAAASAAAVLSSLGGDRGR